MEATNGGMDGLHKPRLGTVILWCRRDLRVTDNPALNAALLMAQNVVSPSLSSLHHLPGKRVFPLMIASWAGRHAESSSTPEPS